MLSLRTFRTFRVVGRGCTGSYTIDWSHALGQYRHQFSFSTLTEFKIRNIGIIAHIDAGKTTTTEKLLHLTGAIRQAGDVDQGNTVMDYLPAERERGITIQSAAISLKWSNHTINLIDTPGHADFTFEVERALSVLDGAVTIFDGVAGVEAQTEKVWAQASARAIARIAYINKLDRVGADHEKTVSEMRRLLGTQPALLQIPVYRENAFDSVLIGLCDLLNMKVLLWHDANISNIEIVDVQNFGDERLKTLAETARGSLIEVLAEHDEAVVEAFIDCPDPNAIPATILQESLRRLCHELKVTPVLLGSSYHNIGLQPLLQAVVDYLPSPREVRPPRVLHLKQEIKLPAKSTFAYAFKVVIDPQKGPMVYLRVYQGTLRGGSTVMNTTAGTKDRIQKLYHVYADTTIEAGQISEGNICVAIGLKSTRTGDTIIASSNAQGTIDTIAIPPAVFSVSLETGSPTESKALTLALNDLLLEDPSLTIKVDTDTEQVTLNGMGELHLEIAVNRLREYFKARVEVGEVQIGYRESVRELMTLEETCERAIGDKHLSLRMRIAIAPLSDMEPDMQVISAEGNSVLLKLPEDAPNSKFTQTEASTAIINGLRNALNTGPLLDYPMHNCFITLNITEYELDTTLAMLSIAAHHTCTRILKQAPKYNVEVIEPIMCVSLSIPEQFLGSTLNDLTSNRNGQILSLDDSNNDDSKDVSFRRNQGVLALVPLQHMVGYNKVLRQLTGGRATFTMQVESFRAVDARTMQRLERG